MARARLQYDVSTVHDHRSERFKYGKGAKRARTKGVFHLDGMIARPSWDKLRVSRGGKQRAGCTGGVEAAVGLAAACGFDLLRMAGDVVKQPPEILYQLAPGFFRHG